MNRVIRNQRGAFVVIFALSLLVLLGFVALGIEGGRWYLVRAELAKGVDAASLNGAKNISNPFVTPTTLAEEFGRENFQAGYVGTPASGAGSIRFTATMVESDKISVTGNVDATATLARIFGFDRIPVAASGVAQKREVEILMILDRSGSMGMPGSKMTALKNAANSFLGYFRDTQDKDKLGLLTFATTANVDVTIKTQFYSDMNTTISGMQASGWTNTEDALARANTSGGFKDQTGVPGDKRIQQFVVFFSDGMPTALRDRFRYNNVDYDGVISGTSNDCGAPSGNSPTGSLDRAIYKPDAARESQLQTWTNGDPNITGDGKKTSGTPLTTCGGSNRYLNTKWYLFETSPVPRSGGGTYPPEQCTIPANNLLRYFCGKARGLAQDHATVLKNRGIKIYVIGLGTAGVNLDETFLQSLSNGTDYTYITPNSSELQAIFNKIAKDITLRLVY